LGQLSSVGSTPRPAVTFHLLDVDPIYLVMNGGLESMPQGGEVYKEHPRLKTLAGKLNARRLGGYSLSLDVFLFLDQSRPLWESHVIRSGQTDATGNAVLDDLAKGTYWLVAYSRASGGEAFWLQQIDIKDGATEVELLRSNALYIKLPS
ncbi:MAG TPA: carboxypeptidase-like regulatory domain-containing protein, partial [Pyrinomonadaceae bacterium]